MRCAQGLGCRGKCNGSWFSKSSSAEQQGLRCGAGLKSQESEFLYIEMEVSVTQLCPTLCDPMDCSPRVSSAQGIFQARILEWVAISSCRGFSWLRDRTYFSCIGRQILYYWAAWETLLESMLSFKTKILFFYDPAIKVIDYLPEYIISK